MGTRQHRPGHRLSIGIAGTAAELAVLDHTTLADLIRPKRQLSPLLQLEPWQWERSVWTADSERGAGPGLAQGRVAISRKDRERWSERIRAAILHQLKPSRQARLLLAAQGASMIHVGWSADCMYKASAWHFPS